ncbi:hypothetical protein [Bowmanella yangjiangensis]|uniref:Glycosyltransferase family 1 protein n=1 Tax=Bowmanella yangjiangensis TaxID=2811230 RepID=A0ABS3CP51_9ALTE|nr:hypothetical protein [Bowmanella yangjiangensis]MBN7818883.1 hypothetical protein [Bowmanella yangjiangensis]
MRVLFITGQNQYGVVSHFLAGMREDLQAAGVDSDTLSVESEQSVQRDFPQLLPLEEYDQVISFNGMGLHLEYAGLSVPDYLKRQPAYVFCVDHPLHLLKRFIGLNVVVLCVDEEHVAFSQLCGFNAVYFPHAIGKQQFLRLPVTPVSNKNDDIVFPISFMDSVRHRQALEPYWQQIGKWVEQSQSVTRFMQMLGVLPLTTRKATLPLNEEVLRVCVTVDSYLRAKQRETCLQQCQKQGLVLQVIGRDSHQYQAIAPAHQYLPAMDFTALLETMAKARYVLHNSPGFDRGLHERVIYPLSLGTLVLTFNTPYVNQTFPQGCIDVSSVSIEIDDDTYAEQRAAAQQIIAAQHCWQQQLATLFKLPPTFAKGMT